MGQFIDSLCACQDVVLKIAANQDPAPELLEYTLKTAHSMLLEKVRRISPQRIVQDQVQEWLNGLGKSLLSAPLFLDQVRTQLCFFCEFFEGGAWKQKTKTKKKKILIVNKDNCSDDYYITETYKVFARLCRDLLKSFTETQLEEEEYFKLVKVKDEPVGENQANLTKTLNYIRIKSIDSFGIFFFLPPRNCFWKQLDLKPCVFDRN